eukprot:897610-Pelagomonas_calceolata.AAC.1
MTVAELDEQKQHIQGDVPIFISSLITTHKPKFVSTVLLVKPHAGIAGNERADAIAKYQANQANNSVADAGIPGAGPDGNPFPHLF